MTWSAENSVGDEQAKIRPFVIPYTRGMCLDLGCGPQKCWPYMIGIDQVQTGDANLVRSIADLSIFADNSVDAVFSSHALEDIEDTRATLAEWFRVVRPGGNLVLYLPDADLYPNIGTEGANPAHKHDFRQGDIHAHMLAVARVTGQGWDMLEDERRGDGAEYSFYQVYQKRSDAVCGDRLWQRNPGGKKRCMVIRFGAIGDCIQSSVVLKGLQEQGYHVTMCTTPAGREVLKHNPYIDDWWVQDKDQVPNQSLDPYFRILRSRFDKIVNLSESVEGSLLLIRGRSTHWMSLEARRRILGHVNYLERQHDIAGTLYEFSTSRFYPTEAERAEAVEYRASLGPNPVVYWVLSGTSLHKIYPFSHLAIGWLLQRTDATVLLVGGKDERELADGVMATLDHPDTAKVLKSDSPIDMSRVVQLTGEWPIRRALTFLEQADVIVGPETGALNAAAMLKVPKVIMLSHSSHENLTKHWEKTIVLEPTKTPCFPCHALHYNWDDCSFVEETSAALCASNIRPEVLFDAVAFALGKQAWPQQEAAD